MSERLLHRLAASEHGVLLARLLEIADDAVVIVDAEQRIVLFNAGAERLFGHSATAMIGEPLDRLLPDEVRARHARHLREFAVAPMSARRMGERSDIRGRRADGSPFDAEASIARMSLNGEMYFAAIVRDVSEARSAARALAESEATFRTLARSAPVGIFTADMRGQCRYVNERWCELAGVSAIEAQGLGWLGAVHPMDRDAVREAWGATVGHGQPMHQRFRFARPDGSASWVVGNVVASLADDGSVQGFVGTVTDVTQSHLQGLALEQAKADAESATRAKSLFLANMSHEIRTPLNAIVGMTSLLLSTPMTAEQLEFAHTIRSSSQTLQAVVDDILDFSKSEAGRLEIEHLEFDLRSAIEESLDMIAPRAAEKGLNLAYLIEDGTPETLVGDAGRLRQILVNLLANAVKFTHQGEVLVSVDCTPAGADTCRLHLAVKDTGIGIAPEHLPRLFQSFSQVDATTTRKYGGTGLGLAISKRLAELMGGSITVHSQPGEGSVFHVTVQVGVAAHAATAEFLQRDVPPLRGKRVLIVDDNVTNRRILSKMTLQWGMRPTVFPSALEALDRIRFGEPYDLALIDMSMPEIDGIELAARVQRQYAPHRLPVVMLSSLGQRQRLAAQAGATVAAVLSKPIKAGELYATLLRVVQGQAAEPVTAASSPASPAGAKTVRPARVLVAEDNEVNRRVVQRLLERLGHQADLVSNGLEALDAVERHAYDVVLMDIQMPEMDGLQAARWIAQRRLPRGRPRIIAMTANVSGFGRDADPRYGFDAFLPKPIQLDHLAALLEQAAAGQGAAPDLPAPTVNDVLDYERLEHLRALQDDAQPSLVRDVIDLFSAEAPRQLEAIAQAVERGDSSMLRERAHRFLSTTENVGAVALSRLCAALERMALERQPVGARTLVAQMAQVYARTETELAVARARF